ncbi:hypothetical protein BDR26DRAFT_227053 [Obelidium mucronatum]|nr:hypothetical protein BDR26DRAFT_227053 [Obelidium mucronatum]
MEAHLTELNIQIVAQIKKVDAYKQNFQAAIQNGQPADIRADYRSLFEGATQVLLALLQSQTEFQIAWLNERAASTAAFSGTISCYNQCLTTRKVPAVIPVAAESSGNPVKVLRSKKRIRYCVKQNHRVYGFVRIPPIRRLNAFSNKHDE